MKKIFVYLGIGVVIFFVGISAYITGIHSKRESLEIERKWLIDSNEIPYDLSKADKFSIEQTYINFEPEVRVRRINDGEYYTMTVKTELTKDGLRRNEYELFITKEGYESLVLKREGNTILKDRYQFIDDKNIVAIDIFKGDLEGLAYMEIEFESEKKANEFITPSWVVKDVTADIRYKNGHLARFGIPEK